MKRLLVISSYPPKGTTHHQSVIGGASYTKNTLLELKKEILGRDETPEITVLAQKIDGQETSYEDEGIIVKRIWKRNSLLTFTRLYKEILSNHKQTREVLIELELNIFGKSGVFLVLLINFIYSLKLLNKKVTLVIHEVIFDLDKFGPHINLKQKSLKTSIYNSGLTMFYKTILKPVDKVIVFEESLKENLSKIAGHKSKPSTHDHTVEALDNYTSQFTTNTRSDERGIGVLGKISVIPIAVENIKESFGRDSAWEKLGIPKNDFVVMTFGFLAWYKGTDWLADVWNKENSKNNLKLIIAGGANPNRLDLPYYQKYLKNLENVSREKEINLTGFIPEDKMNLYFTSCDIIVFPYRTMMSSSAVLSMVFSFNKPFLLSDNMQNIFMGQDIKEELFASGLKEEDVLFPLDNSFNEKLEKIKNNSELLKKLEIFSQKMKEKRSWDLIRKLYYETLF